MGLYLLEYAVMLDLMECGTYTTEKVNGHFYTS